MRNYNIIMEYDKNGKLIEHKMFNPNITFIYNYNDDYSLREITCKSPNNKNNFLEIITQKKIFNNYINIKKEQIGEKYETTIFYDDFGFEKSIKRVNKENNSNYNKKIMSNKHGEPKIWLEKYNEEINIGFKVDLNKIKVDY